MQHKIPASPTLVRARKMKQSELKKFTIYGYTFPCRNGSIYDIRFKGISTIFN